MEKKKHGGARPNAGRKTKDEEEKVKTLALNALIKEFGGVQEAFTFGASMIRNEKSGFGYFKLFVEHIFGAPQQNVNSKVEVTEIKPLQFEIINDKDSPASS